MNRHIAEGILKDLARGSLVAVVSEDASASRRDFSECEGFIRAAVEASGEPVTVRAVHALGRQEISLPHTGGRVLFRAFSRNVLRGARPNMLLVSRELRNQRRGELYDSLGPLLAMPDIVEVQYI